jgi:hypothetical protein
MLADMIDLERAADAAVERLPVLQLPARAVLAGLHYSVFLGRNGRLFGGLVDPGQGNTIMSRLGHALPLLRRLSAIPYGANADDAIGAFREADPDGSQLGRLLSYLHFSEIMPEVHRGRLVAERSGDRLVLRHPDDAFALAEARDITLSEIALPFPLDRDARIEPGFMALARTAPEIDWGFAAAFIAGNAYKYRHGLAEADLVTETSIRHMFGFERDRYIFIRSALLAFAEFCEKLAITIHTGVFAKKLAERQISEGAEWASVNLDADFVHGFIAAASQSSPEEVERFLTLYTIDYRPKKPLDWGGDGFFPPFARFETSYLFSPALVLAFLQVRNALYAFAKKDRRAFDSDVSHELEPVLLRQAAALLRRSGEWVVREDIPFPGGQIDLFVGAPDDDGVLPVQAKGNLPPQGARLTARLTDRVREGVSQIERFAALGDDEQRKVIARVLGRAVERLDVRQAVLARSCFGALEVLAPDFPHLRLTLPILGLALERHRVSAMPTTIAALAEAVEHTYAEVFDRTGPRWEEGSINVEGVEIKLPLLRWIETALDKLREEWWASTLKDERGDPTV